LFFCLFNALKKEEEGERETEREHGDTLNRNVVRYIAFYWEAGDEISAMNIPKKYPLFRLVKVCRKGGKALESEVGEALSTGLF
jgi:hypothetical protein